MKLDSELLVAVGVKAARAANWREPLRAACALYDIAGPYRLSAFIAQITHESGDLRYVREIWGPTPAQLRYEGRAALGNTQPGDGKRFLGRGLLQVTGRANYTTLGKKLGVDLVKHPELLETPTLACLSAGQFWVDHDLHRLADTLQFSAITRRINGGTNGAADRQRRYNKALAYLLQG